MENKTSIIALPQFVASHTLKCLSENNISCQYEGVDQTGRILMRLNYLSDQDRYLNQLIAKMEEEEKSFTEFLQISVLMLLNEMDNVKVSTELAKLKNEYGNKHGNKQR